MQTLVRGNDGGLAYEVHVAQEPMRGVLLLRGCHPAVSTHAAVLASISIASISISIASISAATISAFVVPASLPDSLILKPNHTRNP